MNNYLDLEFFDVAEEAVTKKYTIKNTEKRTKSISPEEVDKTVKPKMVTCKKEVIQNVKSFMTKIPPTFKDCFIPAREVEFSKLKGSIVYPLFVFNASKADRKSLGLDKYKERIFEVMREYSNKNGFEVTYIGNEMDGKYYLVLPAKIAVGSKSYLNLDSMDIINIEEA